MRFLFNHAACWESESFKQVVSHRSCWLRSFDRWDKGGKIKMSGCGVVGGAGSLRPETAGWVFDAGVTEKLGSAQCLGFGFMGIVVPLLMSCAQRFLGCVSKPWSIDSKVTAGKWPRSLLLLVTCDYFLIKFSSEALRMLKFHHKRCPNSAANKPFPVRVWFVCFYLVLVNPLGFGAK